MRSGEAGGNRRAESCPGRGAARSDAPQIRDRSRHCLAKLFKKIVPVRIEFIDQFELPGPPPALERPFARSCFNDRGEFFDVDESRYTIRAGEARSESLAMFRGPSGEVIRHSNVENAVSAVSEDVDEEAGHFPSVARVPDAVQRARSAWCTADPGPSYIGAVPGLQRTTSWCAAPGTRGVRYANSTTSAPSSA